MKILDEKLKNGVKTRKDLINQYKDLEESPPVFVEILPKYKNSKISISKSLLQKLKG